MVHLVTALHRIAKAQEDSTRQDASSEERLVQLTSEIAQMIHDPERGDDESTRHLSNTVWALAVLMLKDMPLLSAISSQSLNKIHQLDP